MSRVVERAKYLADKTGAAIILVHHNTKSDGTTPRGHGVLLGAVDIALQVRQSNPGIIKVELTKIKNGSKETTFSFQIHIESIGVNFDGNTITVAVCEEPDIDSRPRSSCSKAELSTLQILDELQQSGPVRESDWLSACATGNRVSEAAQPASRLRGARRNIQSLMDKGLVVVTTGIVSRNVGKI